MMGLDMYLRAEKYVSGYDWTEQEEKDVFAKVVEATGAKELVAPDSPSLTVSVTIAYWRKANAIHRWFVENVQEGVDDCRAYAVSRDQLLELRAECAKVLDAGNLAAAGKESLPTQSGFFFGATDYDQWYEDDLKSTVEQIDRVLAYEQAEGRRWWIEYQSSW